MDPGLWLYYLWVYDNILCFSLSQAAITIQAYFRAYKVRKALKNKAKKGGKGGKKKGKKWGIPLHVSIIIVLSFSTVTLRNKILFSTVHLVAVLLISS